MAAEFPTERRFWFAPTFHAGQSALMHRQPDNVWRIDLQLGPEADAAAEQQPDRVRARLDKVLGAASVRAGMGVDLHLQLSPARPLRARPCRLHRRCRPPGLAVRRARRQFRHPGCGESRLEARGAHPRRRRRSADRELRARAHPGGRREYRPFDPLDRFHVAAFERRTAAARRGARSGAQGRVRPPHGQFRTPVAADRLRLRRSRHPTQRRSPAPPSSAPRSPMRRSRGRTGQTPIWSKTSPARSN